MKKKIQEYEILSYSSQEQWHPGNEEPIPWNTCMLEITTPKGIVVNSLAYQDFNKQWNIIDIEGNDSLLPKDFKVLRWYCINFDAHVDI